MPRQCYGIPYMGSKWRLADWILSYLPDAPIDAPQDGERERESIRRFVRRRVRDDARSNKVGAVR